ncbi:MAG: peptide chain release factor N(5)-glutamine methyltransferase [Alphaproteobacteria bacterium]|nr:peptide chain release factor N(5)-glutamine methyltransferase [Alphaproteobacteria bacterium]
MSVDVAWLDILRRATRELRLCGVETPAREARLLLAEALKVDAAGLIALECDAPDKAALESFSGLVAQRGAGKPMSRLRGWREFYGRTFLLTDDVLDPRPETELLVEEGLKRLPPNGRVLDFGVGSGCILATLLAERPDATGVGLDLSARVLAVARGNCVALDVARRVEWIEGGWDAALGQTFDLVVSNPPYIPSGDIAALDREVRDHDPRLALDGGADGLDACRAICDLAPRLLVPGGWLALETGAGQAGDVAALMGDAGLVGVGRRADLAGHERVVMGQRRPAP